MSRKTGCGTTRHARPRTFRLFVWVTRGSTLRPAANLEETERRSLTTSLSETILNCGDRNIPFAIRFCPDQLPRVEKPIDAIQRNPKPSGCFADAQVFFHLTTSTFTLLTTTLSGRVPLGQYNC